jgi:uncharacterized protein
LDRNSHCRRWHRHLPILISVALWFTLSQIVANSQAVAAENIGVYGDSLSDGVWSGLYSIVKHHPDDKLYRHSKVGASLTTPGFDTWIQDFAASLDREHITTVVVMYGANDERGIRDDKHKGYVFESKGWQRIYVSRIDAIYSELAKRKVTAVWVGLPVMRDKTTNAGAAFLNGLYATEAAKFGGRFLPLSDAFVDGNGQFAAYLPDPKGHLREVRINDGVHFTAYGYGLIADRVFSTITSPVSTSDVSSKSP